MAEIISGTAIRKEILSELKQEIQEMHEKHGIVPGLATILVGNNPASVSYVTLKAKTAKDIGCLEIQDNRP